MIHSYHITHVHKINYLHSPVHSPDRLQTTGNYFLKQTNKK